MIDFIEQKLASIKVNLLRIQELAIIGDGHKLYAL